MGGAPSSTGGAEQPDGYGAANAAAAAAAPAVQAPIRSIYALATNAAGTVVGVGTTDSHIRLLDPRTGDKVMKMKVRAVRLHGLCRGYINGSIASASRSLCWGLMQQHSCSCCCCRIHVGTGGPSTLLLLLLQLLLLLLQLLLQPYTCWYRGPKHAAAAAVVVCRGARTMCGACC
jgi:hypothetical protein